MIMQMPVVILEAPLAVVSLPMVGTEKLKAFVENALVATAAALVGCGCILIVHKSQVSDHY